MLLAMQLPISTETARASNGLSHRRPPSRTGTIRSATALCRPS